MIFSLPQYISVVIIGGGQAGLSASYCLRQRGVDDHVILEKHRIGHSWKEHGWSAKNCEDSDPAALTREQVMERLENYVKEFRPPILEGVTVTSVTKREGYFHLTTDKGNWFCDDVIVAIGGQHIPYIPRGAEKISREITQLHSRDYRSASSLPEGQILVIGSGPSGVKIMEDLHQAGRKVHLCLGNPSRYPRSYRGRDVTSWLEDMGELRRTHKTLNPEHYLRMRASEPEIDLEKLAKTGVQLYGFLESIDSEKITTRADLQEHAEDAESAYHHCCQRIDAYIQAHEIDAPVAKNSPISKKGPSDLNFAKHQIRSIIWCTGYQPDFKFIQLPVFSLHGFPETERGLTALPGLYFLGLPWMHTHESASFTGITEDADFIAAKIQASIPECVE